MEVKIRIRHPDDSDREKDTFHRTQMLLELSEYTKKLNSCSTLSRTKSAAWES